MTFEFDTSEQEEIAGLEAAVAGLTAKNARLEAELELLRNVAVEADKVCDLSEPITYRHLDDLGDALVAYEEFKLEREMERIEAAETSPFQRMTK